MPVKVLIPSHLPSVKGAIFMVRWKCTSATAKECTYALGMNLRIENLPEACVGNIIMTNSVLFRSHIPAFLQIPKSHIVAFFSAFPRA